MRKGLLAARKARLVARRGLFAIVFTGAALTALVTPVSAQSTSSRAFDLNAAAIYDFVLNEGNATSNLGAHFDVAKRFIEGDGMSVYGLGEIGFNHFEFVTVSSYAGGLRIGSRRGKNVIFGQMLAGAEHASSATNFMLQPGGGVDFEWKPQFAVRLHLDWRHVFTDIDDYDGFRLGVGLVFPLNR